MCRLIIRLCLHGNDHSSSFHLSTKSSSTQTSRHLITSLDMPSISVYPTSRSTDESPKLSNPLPKLLQTPSGLAILEIQGTIHAPFPDPTVTDSTQSIMMDSVETAIGRIEFPLYDTTRETGDDKWMKKVYLYVGQHQRLNGEVKKLAKPLAILSKKPTNPLTESHLQTQEETDLCPDDGAESLEILEVIRYKVLFGGRPEPVG